MLHFGLFVLWGGKTIYKIVCFEENCYRSKAYSQGETVEQEKQSDLTALDRRKLFVVRKGGCW